MFLIKVWFDTEGKETLYIAKIFFKKIMSLKKNSFGIVSLQDPSAMPRPTSQDLAGFWDLLQLSIDDVTAKFDELQQIKSNQWQLVESPEKKVKLIAVFPGQGPTL